MPQPKVVLPKTEILAKGPPAGLTEVAQSLSATAVSFAQALPAGGLGLSGLPKQGQSGQAMPELPKLKQFALSIEEVGPSFIPKISQLAGQAEKTVSGSSSEVKRGTTGVEEKVPTTEIHRGTL